MGIPFYYYHLSKRYDDIISNHLPTTSIDLFCLDYNGIIHPICQINSNSENTIFQNLWEHTLSLHKRVSPKNMLIAIDGVAPLAKIMQQRKRRYMSSLQKKDGWDSNNITHGTPFMSRLSDYIKKNAEENNFLFDHNDGEAEHKIVELIHQKEHLNKTVLIHGLDADLILLSLLSNCKNIYLMREQNDKFQYLNIDNLRNVIISEWKDIFPTDTIKSYCVCCSLIGNDFIPHPLTMNVKYGAMEKIKHAASKCNQPLIKNNKINIESLFIIINNLANTEDEDLQRMMCKINKPSEHDNYINNNISKWRKYYYNNIIYTNSINNICKEFLDGIHWTFNYYNKDINKIDHGWFYAFNGAPSLRDLANYIPTYSYEPIDTLTDFIPSDLKLIIVIPKISKDVLPKHLRVVYDDDDYGISYMYPSKFRLIKFLKEHDWEYIPCLPIIDFDLMRNTLSNL